MPDDPRPDDEDLLVDHVRRALEAQERGEPVDLAALCADRPDLAPAVADVLGLRDGLGAIGAAADERVPGSGRVLAGRYRLDAPLGRGAMGVVWEGTDLELGRAVAVKLFETLGRPSATDEERFVREATTLASLQHGHVVTIHDRGRDADGALFLVMERLHGATLAELLERATAAADRDADFVRFVGDAVGGLAAVPPESGWLRAVVRWCADVAAGLGAAHARGVFHRDVKPSNVFVRRDLRAVLLDFGIAARAEDPALTVGDTTLGTPWYMAPEQAAGLERASAGIDVYGLAATLYHLTTGRPPYDGDARRVIAALRHDDPVPPHVRRPELPRDLCAIVEKGMERDPARRYPTIGALEADLRAFLAHRPVTARPLTRAARLVRRIRRAPARALAVTATVVALLLVGVVVPLWNESRATALRTERDALFDTLPALLAIEGQPSERLLQSVAERGASLAVLDRMLEIDPDDLPHRLWRAALRLDQGAHESAAADLREIVARAGDSAYVRGVAQRYLDADRGTTGTDAVALDGLPEPATTFDHFLAGFHELRNRHREGFATRAYAHLAAIADDYPPARDLLAIALLGRAETEKDPALFQQVIDETLRQEGAYGRPTARTLALRGAALVGLQQNERAIPLLEESDRLRPDRHGPLHNLGVAWRRMGDDEKAERYLARAHALRPHFWNSTYMLALVAKDRGAFDRAFALQAELPDDMPADEAWRRPELLATILQRRALDAQFAGGDRAAIEPDATRAIELFDAAIVVASPRIGRRLATRREVSRAILADDDLTAFMSYVNLLRLEPTETRTISDVAYLLPERELTPDAILLLRSWMRRLAIALGKGDPAFVEREKARLKVEEGR